MVAKPLDGTCGRGVEFIEQSEKSEIVGLYEMLMQGGQYLVEAFIVQHPLVSHIYPLSVNTLRLVTIKNHDTVHLVFFCTPGADKDGKAYYTHPLTGVALVGAKIPFCKESAELVKQAAMRIPELGYIAWDVALTEKGPIIIEANHFPGHDIYQFQVHLGADKIGLAPRFDKAVEGI